MRIAIFASGNGTNFEVLAKAFQSHEFGENAKLELLFCDHPNAPVIKRAEKYGVYTATFTLKSCGNKEEYEKKILQILKSRKIDLVVLAGYMRVISPVILNNFDGKIINLHPAYLPEFTGLHAIERAFQDHVENGRTQTGVTIHYIDEGLDTGPIIKQEHVPIYKDDDVDTLEARIHQTEHKLYPEVLKKILEEENEKSNN
ncbi:phosphoribosylglycinamide formyltransferase [Ligilactobacillus cholophilus]|uniref:phosphoribosylglycinamide formyltransferase n=1 Tax=Ligilactobacillus cholophilus TaxID=3050131 RepID=UPI0025AEE379|nr:phosphoribosylglycinamide formyltransferase [Ligilactobacillus cholophilus]